MLDLVAGAIADPVRREILVMLHAGPLPAGEIAGRFPITRPAISRHLRVLREAGLVRVRVEGQRRVCTLDPRPPSELDAWLAPHRRLGAQRLDALDTEMVRGRRARAEEDGR
jgi:DNA-binding transcriptional ArsR family regulator